MNSLQLGERFPLRALSLALGGGLRMEEVGLIAGRPGVGKSTLLIQLAVELLLRAEPVLHIALRYQTAHVRDQYESLLEALLRSLRPLDRAEAMLQVERYRMIHARQEGLLTADAVGGLLETLQSVVAFAPKLVVIDGWEPSEAEIPVLQAWASKYHTSFWCAWTAEQAVFPNSEAAAIHLEVVPEYQHLRVLPHRVRGQSLPPVRLEGTLYVAPAEAPRSRLRPADCMLFSGGAAGSEAAFGLAAERWGVKETNYTFDGHVQARHRGAVPLTAAELARGDVSLAYVSRKLRRGFGEGATLRRVLQSLWHQVSQAELVFVVGTIQEDGTVVGGTGWAVELARMWHKRLWVFDQDKDNWYQWKGDDWVTGMPVIDAPAYCGTGSRNLSANAQTAIQELMERSFAATAS